MNLTEILAQLSAERNRLDQAIAALEGLGSSGVRRGRPPQAKSEQKAQGTRTMSASARKRISAAMKQRWAQWKGKAAPKKGTSKRKPMSPAMRKRLSALMKARWAARKRAGS